MSTTVAKAFRSKLEALSFVEGDSLLDNSALAFYWSGEVRHLDYTLLATTGLGITGLEETGRTTE